MRVRRRSGRDRERAGPADADLGDRVVRQQARERGGGHHDRLARPTVDADHLDLDEVLRRLERPLAAQGEQAVALALLEAAHGLGDRPGDRVPRDRARLGDRRVARLAEGLDRELPAAAGDRRGGGDRGCGDPQRDLPLAVAGEVDVADVGQGQVQHGSELVGEDEAERREGAVGDEVVPALRDNAQRVGGREGDGVRVAPGLVREEVEGLGDVLGLGAVREAVVAEGLGAGGEGGAQCRVGGGSRQRERGEREHGGSFRQPVGGCRGVFRSGTYVEGFDLDAARPCSAAKGPIIN